MLFWWLVVWWGECTGILAGGCRCASYCPIFYQLPDTDCLCQLSSGLYRQDPLTGTCGELEDHCAGAGGPCQNGGTCHPRLGSFYCSCPQGFAGQTCNIPVAGTERYPTGVSVFFDIREQVLGYGVTVFVAVSGAGPGLELRLDDGDGWIKSRAELHLAREDPRALCLRHAAYIPDADLRICHLLVPSGEQEVGRAVFEYPVVGADDNRVLRTASGEVVGRLDRLRLEASDGGVLLFSAEYPLFTHFTQVSTACTLAPLLRHCSTESQRPTEYRRGKEIVLRAITRPVHGQPCVRVATVRHAWRLTGDGVDLAVDEEYVFSLDPRNLPFGRYMVEYRVEVLGSYNPAHPNLLYRNFARCWLSVVAVGVVAEIRGGSERRHAAGALLILSALPSLDPNFPDDSRLRFLWKCDPPASCRLTTFTKTGKRLRLKGVPPGRLLVSLRAHSKGLSGSLADTFQQIVDVRSGAIYPGFLIVCCKGSCQKPNPGNVICLRVARYPKEGEISWTVRIEDGSESTIDLMRQPGTPSYILVIKPASLQHATVYHFKAVLGDSEAVYKLRTEDDVQAGRCKLQPLTGLARLTSFTLDCTDYQAAAPLIYQLYQRTANSNGALVSSSAEQVVRGLRLTVGELQVRVLTTLGSYQETDLSISMDTSVPSTEEEVEGLLEGMRTDLAAGDVTATIATVHLLGMNLVAVPDQSALIQALLDILSTVELAESGDAVAVAESVKFLLTSGGGGLLGARAVRNAGVLLQRVAARLLQLEPLPRQLDDLLQLAGTVLRAVDPLLDSKDPRLSDDVEPDHYESAYWDYQLGSRAIVEAVGSMGDLVLHSMVEYQETLRVHSQHLTLLTTVCNGTCLHLAGPVDPSGDGMTNLTFPSDVYPDHVLQLQVAEMKTNPMWWSRDGFVCNSRHLHVRLSTAGRSLSSLPRPLVLRFKATENPHAEEMGGEARRTDPELSEAVRDTGVAVHRLVRPGTGRLILNFNDLAFSQLKVLSVVNELPGAKAVETGGRTVSGNSSVYRSQPYRLSDEDFLYIGILPSHKHTVGKTVKYRVSAVEQTCRVWSWDTWDLATSKVAGNSATVDMVDCRSSHLSIFGASFLVAPMPLYLAKDILLFRGLAENPYVFLIVLFFLLVYLAFFLWANKKDKKDAALKGIHLLEDNFPGHDFGYLVAVFTGEHFGSGTSANVGLRLIGSQASSHAHILNLDKRRLQMGQDSWVLLFSPQHLGDITTLQLWHDCAGSRPHWYCNKVMVYDLTAERLTWFVVEQWLGPSQPEIQVDRQHGGQDSVRAIARDNFINGIREKHLWFSIFARHPRSAFTRRQTLTITLLMVFTTMLTGLMFLGVKEVPEDDPNAHFGIRNLIISVEVLVISLVISTISVSCFRASLGRKKPATKNSEEVQQGPQSKRVGAWLWDLVKQQFWALFLLPPLETVRMHEPARQASSTKHRLLRALAWTVHILTLVMLAFLLVLYGLKYGPNRSFLWAAVVTMSLLKNIFLFSPIKVAFFTLLAAVVFKISNQESLEFEVDPKPVPKKKLKNSKFMKKLLEIRAKPMYLPLTTSEILAARGRLRQETERAKTGTLLLSFCLFTVQFLLVLSLVEYPAIALPPPTKVIDSDSLYKYLIEELLPSLHVIRWYNGEQLDKEVAEDGIAVKGWSADYMHKMLGVARLRQLRITAGSCEVPEPMKDWFEECQGALTSGRQETGQYGEQWTTEGRPVWNYTARTASVNLQGLSGLTYPEGGYTTELGPSLRSSIGRTVYLQLRGWTDEKTRAVILEVPLYGPHSRQILRVALLAESLPASICTATLQVESARYEFSLKDKIEIATLYGLLLILLVCWLVRILENLTMKDSFKFFTKWSNIFDLLIVVFGAGTVVAAVVRAFHFKKCTLQFHQSVRDHYVDFIYPFHMSHTVYALLSTFIFITTLRLISLCHFGKYFYVGSQALKDSAYYILAITIITFSTTGLISFLMYSCGAQHYRFFPIFPFPKKYFIKYHSKGRLQKGGLLFPILINTTYLLSMITVISILIYHYGRAKFNMEGCGVGWDTPNRLMRIYKNFMLSVREMCKILKGGRKREKQGAERNLPCDLDDKDNLNSDLCYVQTGERAADMAMDSLPNWLAKRRSTHRRLINNLDAIIVALDKGPTKT